MNYLVVSEIILFAVYSFEIYKTYTPSSNIYLLIALIYACLKLLLYIFYDKKSGKPLSIIVFLLTGISGCFFYPMTLFFALSLNQANLLTIKKGWAISLLSLLWLFVLPTNFILVFLLSFGFSTIIIYMGKDHMDIIQVLDKKNENLRKSQKLMKEQIETYSQIAENITYQSQLEERNKLSQALHDELGHTLSGNILRLEATRLVIDKDVEKSKSMLKEVIENLRSGMDSIRAILKSVKPEVSTVNIASLKLLIDNVKQQSDVSVKLTYNSDINELNNSMWKVIMPNIKEALTNMMKYSHAENCEIEFVKLNKIYRVSIKDDGVGCRSITKGLGMLGIEERMALIEGNAIFDSSGGFSAIMIFPI